MQDPIRQFVQEACISNPGDAVPVVAFVGAFSAWAISRFGGRAPTRSEVVTALQECGFQIGMRDGRKHVVGVAFRPAPLTVNEDGRIVQQA